MDKRVVDVTVRVVLPEILPEVAVMVVVPAATAVARPLLLTVATDVLDEVQVTCVVISWLEPSEYVPKAANWWVNSTGTLGVAGVTEIETGFTVGPAPSPPLHPFRNTDKIILINTIPIALGLHFMARHSFSVRDGE
jgi:hypothetical protein